MEKRRYFLTRPLSFRSAIGDLLWYFLEAKVEQHCYTYADDLVIRDELDEEVSDLRDMIDNVSSRVGDLEEGE